MSKEGTKKVSVHKVNEGDPLDRDSVNNTIESWQEASERVTGLNIREEGLDRRSFGSQSSWSEPTGTKGRSWSGNFAPMMLWFPDKWRPLSFHRDSYTDGGPRFHGGVFINVGGSSGEISIEDGNAAVVEWEWDPDVDSYCILRASFFVRWDVGNLGGSGRDSDGDTISDPARHEQFLKFGICAGLKTEQKVLDDGTIDPYASYGLGVLKDGSPGFNELEAPLKGVRRLDNVDGTIFSTAQIGLNRGVSSYSSKTASIRHHYDRRTAFAQTVTMVAVGASGENDTTFDLVNNHCAIDMKRPGIYRAMLVVKHKEGHGGWYSYKNTDSDQIAPSAGNFDNSPENNYPWIGYVNFTVQKIKR